MIRRLSISSLVLLAAMSFFVRETSAQEELPTDANSLTQIDAGTPDDHLTVTQWVRPKTPGVFKARIIAPLPGGGGQAVDGAEVILRGPDGWKKAAESHRGGRVTITDVQPGTYSLVARAPGFLAVYAMHIVGQNESLRELFPETAEVSCSLIGVRHFEALVLPLEDATYPLDNVLLEERPLEKLARQIRGNELYRVAQNAGGLVGCLYAAGTEHVGGFGENREASLDPAVRQDVLIVRDGETVGRGQTDGSGRFVIANLQPGVYSLITSGPDGRGAVGFELLPPAEGVGAVGSSSEYRFVHEPGEVNDVFAMQVVPSHFGEVVEEAPAPEEMDGSVGGFAAAGTGGGGVGLDGIGALAALAAAAAAAGDGGGGGIIVAPASPSTTE